MNTSIGTSWSEKEFGRVELWDKRCKKSLIRIGESLADNPGLSFSVACGESLRQSGGEIFSHKTTSIATLQQSHYEETVERASKEEIVLVSQDTSTVSYNTHKATQGLGPINTNKDSLGLLMHTALVTRVDGLPLGVIGQKIWSRDKEEFGKRDKRKSLPIEEKESYKWIEGLQWINERLAPHVQRVCMIEDRESDVFEFMSYQRPENVDILLRATQPRLVEIQIEKSQKVEKLPDAIKTLPALGKKTICIERNNKTVEVTLEISAGIVKVLPPKRYGKNSGFEPVKMSVVYAREVASSQPRPKKDEPIEWVLLYSGHVATFEDACRCVDYYTQRWKVERFHYTLKQGFKIEQLQFDDAQTLKKAIAVYSIVAWRTMWVTYYGRLEPQSPALAVVNKDEHEVLEASAEKPIQTARDVVVAIGKLGGFSGGTRRYREPGLKSIWIGWRKLEAMKQGWILARNKLIKLQD